MNGATAVLLKLGVRLLLFGVVFYIAARRNPKVVLHARWAAPVIALVFALLNTGLYWALTPILNLATLGAAGFLMPFIVNMVLLIATVRVFRWHKMPHVTKQLTGQQTESRPLIEIQGIMTTLWMAGILTLAHGLIWVALDYLPNR